MEEKKVHLATKASFEVRSTVSDVVFREESEFEVKMVQNHQKTQILKLFYRRTPHEFPDELYVSVVIRRCRGRALG